MKTESRNIIVIFLNSKLELLKTCWAKWIGEKFNRMSETRKVVCLVAGGLLACGYSLLLLVRTPDIHIRQQAITKAVYPRSLDREPLFTREEYDRIHEYRLYLDSLARAPAGLDEMQALEAIKPGLRDSVRHFESFYQSQLNKN